MRPAKVRWTHGGRVESLPKCVCHMSRSDSLRSRPRRATPLVLHVVEAFGGGVAAVLTDYINSLPELHHVVLAYRRPGVQIGNGLHGRALLIDLPHGKLAHIPAVHDAASRLR